MKPPLAIAMLVVSLDEAATARSATPHQLPSRVASFCKYRAYPQPGSGFFAFVPPPHATASVSSPPCAAAARAVRGGGSGDAGGAKFPQEIVGGKEAEALDGDGLGASKPRGENTIEPAQRGVEEAVDDVADKNTAAATTGAAEAATSAADVHARGKGLRELGGDVVGNAKGSSVGGGGGGGGGGGSDHHEEIAAVGRKPVATAAAAAAAAVAGATAARKHEHVDAKEEALREALLVADGANK